MIHKKSTQLLAVLAFGQAWDTFSYYGTQTILILYALHILQLTQHNSYILYGLYGIFNYAIPILGGMLADHYLGSKKTLILGSLLNILGNIILFSTNQAGFFIGLATSLMGSGIYKSTSTALIGTLHPKKDSQKEVAFTWSYLSVNVGGMLGPLVYGLGIDHFGWHFGFIASAIGILLSLLSLLKYQANLTVESLPCLTVIQKGVIYSGILFCCPLLALVLQFTLVANLTLIFLVIFSLIYFIKRLRYYPSISQWQLGAIIIISFFSMFYFVASMQMGTTVTLFIQQKIQAGLLHTTLPASTFSAFYPLFVLVLAPIFGLLWRWLKQRNQLPHPITKLAISLSLAVLSMSLLGIFSMTSAVITGIILGNLLISAGELLLIPALYTVISDLSPPTMKNTLMGGWFLFIGMGSYLSSMLANAINTFSLQGYFANHYTKDFFGTAIFSLLVLIIFLIVMPTLYRLIKEA